MNVIVHAIRNNLPWEEKLRLFEQFGGKPWMAQQLRKQGSNWQGIATLKRELEILRWKKGLPKAAEPPEVVEEVIEAKLPEQPDLYPKEITLAIAIRAKAINAREKLGRQLTQLYQEMNEAERAENHRQQKKEHAIVAEQMRLIEHYRHTGQVLKEGDLTDREELEKEWNLLRRSVPGYRKNIEMAKTPETKLKAEQRYLLKKARYDQLRGILGKQKRNRRQT